MDFLTKKELDGLKADVKSKEIALEANKATFEAQLKNKLGNDILNTLSRVNINNAQTEKPKSKSLLKRIIDKLTLWL